MNEMRLLIVDDDPEFCTLIRHTTPSWLQTIALSSTSEAVEALETSRFETVDIALVDMNMPPFLAELAEHEGPCLIRWMVEHDLAVPTILVSAQHRPEEGTVGGFPSVVGFLRKPLDLQRLYAFLSTYAQLFETTGNRGGGRQPRRMPNGESS